MCTVTPRPFQTRSRNSTGPNKEVFVGMGICFNKSEEDMTLLGGRVDPSPLKNSNAVIIFVIGGPGVGKITLCKRLSARYGLVLIWVSNILREEVASNSERGRYFKAFMEKGENVPAIIIVQVVLRKMLEYSGATGYLVVGFPRDKKQAVLFNSEVRPPDLLINLYARRVILQERMAKRTLVSSRFDDTNHAVGNRVISYFVHVKGAISPNKSVAKIIDAEGNTETVYLEACKLIEETLPRL